jgi:hypothetical protein
MPENTRGPGPSIGSLYSASPANGSTPALLSLVDPKWLEQAQEEFKAGKEEIYFGTNSRGVGPALRCSVPWVYFKTKGRFEIIASAPLVSVTTENIPHKRLAGLGDEDHWKYYYGFKKISELPSPIPISSLRYFRTGKNVRDDVPGACIIQDPFTND